MSGPATRSRTKNQQEPQPGPSTAEPQHDNPAVLIPEPEQPIPAPSSKASTVSHNKTDQNKTVRSKASSITLRKREAELERAKRLAEVEKNLIEKEYEVTLARLSANGSHCSASSRSKRSRVQQWLTSELQANEQDLPATYPPQISTEHIHDPEREFRYEVEHVKPSQLVPKPSDIQLLAREISKLRRPTETKELPYFNGSVNEWLSFKAAVNDIRASSTENEIIAKFRRCLKGEARTTVSALLDTNVPVSEIMEALELRFGLPELILQEEIQALKDLPKLADNTEQLSKFACKVRNCVSTIKALNKPEHLYNIELLRTLKQKMPHLKTRWLSYALEHEYEDEPELVKLSAFLKREAQTTSRYWLHEPSRAIAKPPFNRTHYAEFDDNESDPEPCYASNPSKEPAEMICLHCKSKNHFLRDCKIFLQLPIDQRWDWAKENKICFKCLKSTHRRENCRARQCGVDGCRMSHNKLLHSPTCQKPETSACVHLPPPTSTSTEATSEPVTENPPHGTTACSRSTRTRVLLKIIPIKIHGPIASKQTYALLDGGSTLTLLKQELAKEIGLKGASEPLILSGVNSTSEEPESERVDLDVVGPSDVSLQLYGVRTVKRLPLAPQTVTDIDGYKHLQDLPRTGLCYDHAVPELLIGQDNWHAIISKEIRHGNRNEPVATLTPLGWVVHGFSYSFTNTVHFVGHTDQEMHQLIEDYFKIDSLGATNKIKQSLEDERAINIFQKTARRWEVGLLWREDNPIMPDSYLRASKSLLSVERNRPRASRARLKGFRSRNVPMGECVSPTSALQAGYCGDLR